MYIHSGQTIRASRNPRLELKSLYHVAFPQQRRSPAYVNGRQSFCPYLGCFDSRCSKARSDDHHFFKLPRAFGVHIISDRRRRRRLAQPATGQHNVIAAYLITYVSATEHVGKNPLQRTLACVYGHFYIAHGISLINKILAGLLHYLPENLFGGTVVGIYRDPARRRRQNGTKDHDYKQRMFHSSATDIAVPSISLIIPIRPAALPS